jgi:hypothetical protein
MEKGGKRHTKWKNNYLNKCICFTQ